jgi:hypothetical protein
MSLNASISCLDAHLAAENEHDLDAIMTTYVADPRVTINGQTFRGLEKVRSFHERFGFGGGGAFSHIKVEERKRHTSTSGDVVVIEQTLSGIHTGVGQGIQPTQKGIEVQVCTVYSFSSDAKLSSEDVYFDSTSIYKQLDIAP